MPVDKQGANPKNFMAVGGGKEASQRQQHKAMAWAAPPASMSGVKPVASLKDRAIRSLVMSYLSQVRSVEALVEEEENAVRRLG